MFPHFATLVSLSFVLNKSKDHGRTTCSAKESEMRPISSTSVVHNIPFISQEQARYIGGVKAGPSEQ